MKPNLILLLFFFFSQPYPGVFYTGDGAARDEHGYIWIKGRVDGKLWTVYFPNTNVGGLTQHATDVINVSGHRLSTAEIESALILHKGVAETAVVGTADELTGQAVYAFVTLKPCVLYSPPVFAFLLGSSCTGFLFSEFKYDPGDEPALVKELVLQVRKVIGPFAAPKKVFIVPDLPKTRSGKIMRRIMRKIIAGEGDQLGDLSTLAEPGVVDLIKEKVASS